ncbi:MAG: hypothetical protein PHU24_06625 [Sphaerochaetaceae bacterium]|nr:hypothetical protein [Sphaerochaetaceae bacterium]MDD4763195.1 hypothetical protein [Sphaerochaetaceae bacterium]MDD4842347.1 hypothetical protein [Sphaerochaetaceae bacterium]MDD5076040.1 hypothetical protein [Sphaerochaetaceae bacterium]NLO60185.1 hypothetical protein [Spirochaetales bacterium]
MFARLYLDGRNVVAVAYVALCNQEIGDRDDGIGVYGHLFIKSNHCKR